jgi:hypothetical protein
MMNTTPSWGPGVGVGDDFGSNGLPLMINVRYKFVLLGALLTHSKTPLMHESKKKIPLEKLTN